MTLSRESDTGLACHDLERAVEAIRQANRLVCHAISNMDKLRDNHDRRKIEAKLTEALDVLQAELDEQQEAVRDGSTHPEDGDPPRADGGSGSVGARRLGRPAGSTGRGAGMGVAGESVAAGARGR